MKRLLTWLPALVLGALLINFIIANRHPVVLSLSPFAADVNVRLYLIFFLGIFSGIGIAVLFAAIRNVKVRLKDARHRRELGNLEAQVRDLEAALDAKQPDEGTGDVAGDNDGGNAIADNTSNRTLAKS